MLRAVGEIIRAGVRRIDTAARYGGDEFVVVLPETDPTGAYVLAEKIRMGVADLDLAIPQSNLRPSLSIGVVAYPGDGRTSDELMIAADAAMYRSKRSGRPGSRPLRPRGDRKSTRLNSSHATLSRMPSSA